MSGYVALSTLLSAEFQPTNPNATTATVSKVMMGLGTTVQYTPKRNVKLFVIMCGDVSNNTATRGTQYHLRYGTGAPPANADADTGTALGRVENRTMAAGGDRPPFSIHGTTITLVAGTTYWFDIAVVNTGGAGTSTLANITASIFPTL